MNSIKKLNRKKRENIISLLQHDISGPINPIKQSLALIAYDCKVPNLNEIEAILEQINNTTKDIAGKIEGIKFQLKHPFDYIRKLVQKPKDLEKAYTHLTNTAHELKNYFPVKGKIDATQLNNDCKELFEELDFWGGTFVYSLNKFLSEEFKSNTNYLDKDVKDFEVRHNRFNSDGTPILTLTKYAHVKSQKDIAGRVAYNIINNGFTHAFNKSYAGKKHIDVNIMPNKDEQTIRLIIADNGSGIPKGLEEKIFEKGFSTRENNEGRGIGLHAVKDFVENELNGTIYVEDNNPGARFEIEFPYKDIQSGTYIV